MRRNFSQVLKKGNIDLKTEYSKFYELFYGKDSRDDKSMADMVSNNFLDCHFRGTCLSLDEFDKKYGFHFELQPPDFNIDYLVSFMEYIYNFLGCINGRYFFSDFNIHIYYQQIQRVLDEIGYIITSEDGLAIFVPKDSSVIATVESEAVPEKLSYKLLEYIHHSSQGNLEQKKEILIKIADALEARRDELKSINAGFSSDLFMLINSCNIRHNNVEQGSTKYKRYIANMSEIELENLYDEIYRMCLLAFMQLEHAERKTWLENIKDNINNIK